jgi:hypothetical protein
MPRISSAYSSLIFSVQTKNKQEINKKKVGEKKAKI